MPDWLTLDNLLSLAQDYRALGPLFGILLPFIESFLPFIPLVALVIANANAYGLWLGFLLSWIGTVAGSYAVFLLVRMYGHTKVFRFMTKNEKVQKLIHWVEMKGFSPLFLLLCFPFTPSALVNVVAGLSDLKKKNYLLTLMASKLVMIFMMSFVGHDLRALVTKPIRTTIVAIVIFLLWWIGKRIEKRLNEKVEKDLRSFSHKSHVNE